jgi:ABC-2 type transport system permease protein
MNTRAIRAIIRKDLRQVTQNKMVWLPMIIVPALLQVIMPVITVVLPTMLGPEEFGMDDMGGLLRALPSELRGMVGGMDALEQYIFLSANYMFAPLFLVVPLMISSILAADSLAGEKERKTLESLLYTPITDGELFLAKVLGAFVPAQAISLVSFALYGVVVNLVGYQVMGRIFFPVATWWPLVLWLGPAVSLLGLGATVLVSSKVNTFMQAQQASGLLVLPIVGLMIAQMGGVLFLSVLLVLVLGLVAWIVGIWLVWIGARTLARGQIIARI